MADRQIFGKARIPGPLGMAAFDLPLGGGATTRLDHLTDCVLRQVMGSTQNVGLLPRRNVRTAVEFFDKYNVDDGDLAKWVELLRGIDLHAVDPIRVLEFSPGELVAQYNEPNGTINEQGKQQQKYKIGQWMIRAQKSVTHGNLGLSGDGRTLRVYRVTSVVEVLASKAASAADHWTKAGAKPHTAVTVEGGKRVMKDAQQVAGGGDQYFLPKAWNFLVDVTDEVSKKGPPDA